MQPMWEIQVLRVREAELQAENDLRRRAEEARESRESCVRRPAGLAPLARPDPARSEDAA